MAFYAERWSLAWQWLTVTLVLSHFVVPFIVLLSRKIKRSRFDLTAMASILMVSHLIDVAWLVLPTVQPSGLRFGASELAVLALAVSTLLFVIRSSAPTRLSLNQGVASGGVVVLSQEGPKGPGLAWDSQVAPTPIRYSQRASPPQIVRFRRDAPPSTKRAPGVCSVAGALAAVVLCGAGALASSFEWRVRSEIARRRSVAIAALHTMERDQSQAQLGEYRWITRTEQILRIPVEHAKELVVAEYASTPAKAAPKAQPGARQ